MTRIYKPRIRIKSSRSSNTIYYAICPLGRPSGEWGDVILDFSQLHKIKDELHQRRYPILKDIRIADTDLVAYLNQFYPNGRYAEEVTNYERRGVGTRVLERLVRDSRTEHCKAILATTKEDPMKSFLRKHGFSELPIELSWNERSYYKLLVH